MGCIDRDTLIETHLTLVQQVVRSFSGVLPSHVDRSDLESAGYLGLVDAAAKFDRSKHIQFKSYAQFRIRGAILDSLRATDWSPRQLRRQAREVERAMQLISHRNGRAATEPQVANELGLDLASYQQLLSQLRTLEIGTLHVECNEESGEEELAYLPGPTQDEPLFQCLRNEMNEHLQEAIEELPERERLVISLYYAEELSLREIGLALGIGESRVSQIRSSAVARLRSALAALAPVFMKAEKAAQPTRSRVAA